MNRSRWIAAVLVALLVVLASYLLGGGDPAPQPGPVPADGATGG